MHTSCTISCSIRTKKLAYIIQEPTHTTCHPADLHTHTLTLTHSHTPNGTTSSLIQLQSRHHRRHCHGRHHRSLPPSDGVAANYPMLMNRYQVNQVN